MKVRNNYNECITNLACSIRKYFDLSTKHNSLEYIDKIVEEKNPKNVVIILFDGMGSRIIDRTLGNNSFFIKNKFKDITTVFPATTTAATTSIRTGLNPVEHCWLEWNTYIKPIDKTITLFLNSEKGKEEICKEFINYKPNIEIKTIVEEINENNKYKGIELFPFGKNQYKSLDDMIDRIKSESLKDGKKYIYAYDNEPDSTMHDFGPDSKEAKELIKERNNKIEELCETLKDTIIIVIADHGHIKIEPIFLNEYPEILELLERTTSLEQRAISFKIKDQKQDLFKERFNKLFGEFFKLYEKQDIINSKLFGEGSEHELFNSGIGDFIAIAENTNKCLITEDDEILVSNHAGYTDDEIYIPLIIIDKC